MQNSPLPGITKLFPARESLVSDIPAGDGKIVNLFLQCIHHLVGMDYRRVFPEVQQEGWLRGDDMYLCGIREQTRVHC